MQDVKQQREARKLRLREVQKERAKQRSDLPDSETQVCAGGRVSECADEG